MGDRVRDWLNQRWTANLSILLTDLPGLGNAKFLADLYHLARGGEDPEKAIAAYADRIGHVQIANCPGRQYPGSGSLDFAALLGQLDAAGYDGYIGLEYKPLPDAPAAANFSWLPGSCARPRESKA